MHSADDVRLWYKENTPNLGWLENLRGTSCVAPYRAIPKAGASWPAMARVPYQPHRNAHGPLHTLTKAMSAVRMVTKM